MNYNVVVTDRFKKQAKRIAKKYPSLRSDLIKLIDLIEKEPGQGVYLGNNCYKIRMAITSKGKGKAGGARIITCVIKETGFVYLLTIYDKSDKESLSDKELDELLKLAGL